jgi:hypothetical protein
LSIFNFKREIQTGVEQDWNIAKKKNKKKNAFFHSIEQSSLTEIFNLAHAWLIVVQNYVRVPKQYCIEYRLNRVSFKDKALLW